MRYISKSLVIALVAIIFTSNISHAAGPWQVNGWWQLNETGGNTATDIVGKNTGKVFGTTVAIDCNEGSRCRRWDGINDIIFMPFSPKNQPGSQHFRIHATVWPEGPKSSIGAGIFKSGDSSTQIWAMQITNTGQASCLFKGSQSQSFVTGGPDLYNSGGHNVECRLMHKLGVGGKDRTELWVDGVLRKYLDNNVGTIQTGQPSIAGVHWQNTPGFYKGYIDDLIIWTSTL